MTVIALEEHALPKEIAAAAGVSAASLARGAGALDDVGEGRLKAMDEAGIDMQVLGPIGHELQELEPSLSLRLCRDVNDRMAAAVAANPTRFRAFATLPICDPKAASDELRRCIEELGFVGTMINGQTHGVFLDYPEMEPVLAAAEELAVPIYLHPAPPPPAVFEAYFSGLEPVLARSLSAAGWGWHAECGLHVLRMVVSGVFERFPGLQIIVGHMGEMLPFSLARADGWLTRRTQGLTKSVGETIQQHVYITTAGYTTDPPLLCSLMVMGADRIMFSVDYPFSDACEATDFLRNAPISPSDREKIAHSNAERLLRL